MKILFLPAYFYPETAASGYLGENRNQAFADAGFEMDAYTPMPCRGISKELREKYKKKRIEKLYDVKMTLHRFSMFAEGRNPILRALRYVFCWIAQGWKGLRAKDVDCIYLASTPPIQGMLGAFLKKRKNVPFVYNLQDIFPDSLVGTGLAKKGGLLWKKMAQFMRKNGKFGFPWAGMWMISFFLMRHNRKKHPPSGKPRRMFFCANGVLLV